MTTIGNRPPGTPQVIPYLYYADADAAFAFLQEAFGFTEHHAVRDRDGSILTAQLSTGDALVMVGPGMAGFGPHVHLRGRRRRPLRAGAGRRGHDRQRARPARQRQPHLRGGRQRRPVIFATRTEA